MLIWGLVGAALLALFALALWGIRQLEPPDVRLTSVRPERLTAAEQRLRVGLELLNPNPLPLPVLSMTYRLWLEEHAIASGEGDLRRRVPARGAAQMELLVSADARNLTRTLPRLALTPQPWRYRLEGTVAVLPRVRIAYRHLGEIDLRGLVRLALSLRQRTLPATSRRPDPGAGAGPGPGREPGGDAER